MKYSQKQKEKNFGSAPQRISDTELKKQKRHQYIKPRDFSYFVSSANNLEASKAADYFKKKQKQQPNKNKNTGNIICYNCNKKRFMLANVYKLQETCPKTSGNLGNLQVNNCQSGSLIGQLQNLLSYQFSVSTD